jgi:hypothetical protein
VRAADLGSGTDGGQMLGGEPWIPAQGPNAVDA